MKKLAVNSESRIVNFDLYNRFTNFHTQLYGNVNFHPDASSYKNISYTPLSYKNPFLFDPIQWRSPVPTNLSWKTLRGLEDQLNGSSLIGITDTYYFWNYQAARYAKRNKIPIYTVIWCNIPHHISSWLPPYSWITKEVIRDTSLFVIRNNKAFEFTDSLKIPREKIKVIYPGINLDLFTTATRTNDEKIKILFVGSLSEAKGVKILLKAFKEIRHSNKNVELHFVGNGPLKDEIKQAAKSLPIHYHGHVHYSQLPQMYQMADIFCSPSQTSSFAGIPIWHEYFSYTLLEAQSAGLPIITTKSGGIPEEVNPQNTLIDEHSTDQLIIALTDMINNHEKRIQLGKINRRHAEMNYNIANQAQLLENELLKLI